MRTRIEIVAKPIKFRPEVRLNVCREIDLDIRLRSLPSPLVTGVLAFEELVELDCLPDNLDMFDGCDQAQGFVRFVHDLAAGIGEPLVKAAVSPFAVEHDE